MNTRKFLQNDNNQMISNNTQNQMPFVQQNQQNSNLNIFSQQDKKYIQPQMINQFQQLPQQNNMGINLFSNQNQNQQGQQNFQNQNQNWNTHSYNTRTSNNANTNIFQQNNDLNLFKQNGPYNINNANNNNTNYNNNTNNNQMIIGPQNNGFKSAMNIFQQNNQQQTQMNSYFTMKKAHGTVQHKYCKTRMENNATTLQNSVLIIFNGSINKMNEYKDKSIEELRAEDYKLFKTLNLPEQAKMLLKQSLQNGVLPQTLVSQNQLQIIDNNYQNNSNLNLQPNSNIFQNNQNQNANNIFKNNNQLQSQNIFQNSNNQQKQIIPQMIPLQNSNNIFQQPTNNIFQQPQSNYQNQNLNLFTNNKNNQNLNQFQSNIQSNSSQSNNQQQQLNMFSSQQQNNLFHQNDLNQNSQGLNLFNNNNSNNIFQNQQQQPNYFMQQQQQYQNVLQLPSADLFQGFPKLDDNESKIQPIKIQIQSDDLFDFSIFGNQEQSSGLFSSKGLQIHQQKNEQRQNIFRQNMDSKQEDHQQSVSPLKLSNKFLRDQQKPTYQIVFQPQERKEKIQKPNNKIQFQQEKPSIINVQIQSKPEKINEDVFGNLITLGVTIECIKDDPFIIKIVQTSKVIAVKRYFTDERFIKYFFNLFRYILRKIFGFQKDVIEKEIQQKNTILLYNQQILDDNQNLMNYGIQTGETLSFELESFNEYENEQSEVSQLETQINVQLGPFKKSAFQQNQNDITFANLKCFKPYIIENNLIQSNEQKLVYCESQSEMTQASCSKLKDDSSNNFEQGDKEQKVDIKQQQQSDQPQEQNLKQQKVSLKQFKNQNEIPLLNKPGYFMEPKLNQILDFKNVEDFKIYTKHAKIHFLGKTNITNLNLDKIINITQESVELYENTLKPEIGKELNKPALITFKIPQKRWKQFLNIQNQIDHDKIQDIIKQTCNERGSLLQNYDKHQMQYTIRVEHF